MGADLHVNGIENTTFYDAPLEFIQEYGQPPSKDVTMLRDAEEVPQHVRTALYADEMAPAEALVVADALELTARSRVSDEHLRTHLLATATWIHHWAKDERFGIEGMH